MSIYILILTDLIFLTKKMRYSRRHLIKTEYLGLLSNGPYVFHSFYFHRKHHMAESNCLILSLILPFFLHNRTLIVARKPYSWPFETSYDHLISGQQDIKRSVLGGFWKNLLTENGHTLCLPFLTPPIHSLLPEMWTCW